MRKFVFKVLLFAFILITIFLIGVILPATPRASTSYLFTKIDKDSLLANVDTPRIIFIGGSNLSFGLNSQMVKDSLGLNPINTGIQVGIGLIYMMENVLPYIKTGDIVVVAYEYHGFYGEIALGEDALLRIVLDVDPDALKMLSNKQLINLCAYLPKYSFSKFKPTEYIKKYIDKHEDKFNVVKSFNEYGDVVTHWDYNMKKFSVVESIKGEFNYSLIDELKKFELKLQHKGAVLYITFPGYQATSFENCRKQIKLIEDELSKCGFILLGKPEDYMVPDSLMFDTPYHLSKKGVDLRTNLLINDLRNIMENKDKTHCLNSH